MSELEQLAYRSRALLPMDGLLNIADILASCQRNNWRDGITGALAYSDGLFFQVVEGQPDAVARLMRRVSMDPRHDGVEVVLRRPLQDRMFGDWSMAMPRISPVTAPLMRRAVEASAVDPDLAVTTLLDLTAIDALHS